MPSKAAEDAAWAFDAYQAVRHRLPAASFPVTARQVRDLSDLADDFDVFLLDAFGVLNIGETAIPGAPDRVAALQAAGKTVIVVSNAASYPKRVLLGRYRRLGFDFEPEMVLTSRQVVLSALAADPGGRLGVMLPDTYGCEELAGLDIRFLADDPADYASADRFLLLGSGTWTAPRQTLLEQALQHAPRPVLVGNPDIVAPRETGLSKEPGHYAHRLADATGITPDFFGKPFPEVFRQALQLAPPGTVPARVVMVGDTLHTDILGGRVAGVSTALITGYGSLKDIDAAEAIARSGIVPDYVLDRP